jgi:serine/threonine protein kinase
MGEPILIGPYKVLKELGNGSHGSVYLAEHSESKLQVALKIYEKNKTNAHLISREVGILARLSSPYIVKMIENIDTAEYLILALEYVPGGDLGDYLIRKGPLAEDECKRIFSQLVEAVNYMHGCKIIHRDIKLENIMVNGEKNIKIIDFSLGCFLSPHTSRILSSFCGTPKYAPPEVWTHESYKGPKVDVWGLGIVLYAMITACLPFTTTKDIILGRYEMPTWISPEMKTLIDGTLEPDLERRFSMEDVSNSEWLQNKIPIPHEVKFELPPTMKDKLLSRSSSKQSLAHTSISDELPFKLEPTEYR